MAYLNKLWQDVEKDIWPYIRAFLRWGFFVLLIGGIGGVLGAVFAQCISYVTGFRTAHSWVLYLMPLGGVAIVALYRLLGVTGVNTNDVLQSVSTEKNVPIKLTPAIFLGTVITHLVGGSAGREGAALQLGGSVATGISRLFRLDLRDQYILILCGMAAFFAALFGTPVGACVFAIEVVSVGRFHSAALFPAMVSSTTAFGIARSLGIMGERFPVVYLPKIGFTDLWQTLLVAVAAAVVSMLFCAAMHNSSKLLKKTMPNGFLRVIVGSGILIGLTLLVGTDYNGGGLHIIEELFETGHVQPEAFALKIIFTAITIGCGFKGGEIVPTLFIGASLGGTLAGLIGMDPAFGAAIGVASMFCGVTNCPIATMFLCFEMFGGNGESLVFFALATMIGFLLSGFFSLYSSQEMPYSKVRVSRYHLRKKS